MIRKLIKKVAGVFSNKGKGPLLYCPFAIKNFNKIEMITRGEYLNKYPIGAVVHYTAGRSLNGDRDAQNTLVSLRDGSFCAFVISSSGTIYQNFPLNKWGYHAGESSYPTIGESLSKKLVGIELCCAGKLECRDGKYLSWFNEEYTHTRRIPYNKDNMKEGVYHPYTKEQEIALSRLLIWLKSNHPTIFNLDYVLGHDEIAPHRKSDPGGSLSMSMPEFREVLKTRFKIGE